MGHTSEAEIRFFGDRDKVLEGLHDCERGSFLKVCMCNYAITYQ